MNDADVTMSREEIALSGVAEQAARWRQRFQLPVRRPSTAISSVGQSFTRLA
jgi:hypothetical protein